MSDDSTRGVSRRKFLVGTGAASAVALAGCSSQTQGGNNTPSGKDLSQLTAGGSSTVYPIMKRASSYWNANRPASDSQYWPHEEYGIKTDLALADYWGSLYGFPTDSKGAPFTVSVGLSHSGTGVEKVKAGQIDIGDSSAPVQAEKPELSQSVYDKFTDHVVGVDGQPIVVSQEIYDEGVTSITGDELKALYKGEITNWQELGGPDRPIQVLGRVKGSGTRTSFVSNVFGDPEASTTVDNRFGQNQKLATTIKNANNAISYLALAFVDTANVKPIALDWKGTTYELGKNLGAKEYPLSRDLHAYTWDGTSEKEAAFLRMVLSDFGQETFVEPNAYFKLPADRLKKQREKLPDPSK